MAVWPAPGQVSAFETTRSRDSRAHSAAGRAEPSIANTASISQAACEPSGVGPRHKHLHRRSPQLRLHRTDCQPLGPPKPASATASSCSSSMYNSFTCLSQRVFSCAFTPAAATLCSARKESRTEKKQLHSVKYDCSTKS